MTEDTKLPASDKTSKPAAISPKPSAEIVDKTSVEEIGGPSGPEPTRYGDWERGGRCSDF